MMETSSIRTESAQSAQPRNEIAITMPDASVRKGTSWETSPMDVAKDISKSLSERVVIAKASLLVLPPRAIADSNLTRVGK
jgi:threonyl-tRNA synthetase